ncbi:MAG: methionyl-tRNA formyltransferase [Ruminococcaceae bacterium]|nr:methionyl-tRNA formyltransferase [Oscillospiraceae bacterium]
MRIVFCGTPDFAETSLRALLDAGRDVVAVFTQPDRPKNRGMKLVASPVKELALSRGIPVYQPETFKDGTAEADLRALSPDLLITVAYGRILPQSVLDIAPKGSVNVHGSLLPKYRGSAPIQWAVLNGDERTGVSIQYMAARMDAGDVIASCETAIGEFETAGELFDRLSHMAAELLVETVDAIEAGTVCRVCQNEAEATYTTMLDKSLCPIDFNRSPREIVKHICGLDPWPVATMELQGETFKVYKAAYTQHKTAKAPGSIVAAGKEGIEIACAAGETLLITEIQPAGKKRMSAAAYLLGHRIEIDE